MAQNQGLLVDVDIEPVSGAVGGNGNNGVASPLTLSDKSADEVTSNNAALSNVFDAIDTIQTYQTSVEASSSRAAGSKHRERNNSVDSTNSIRSYDSTGETCAPHRDGHHDLDNVSGVESAHSGEALLPDVACTSSASGSRGSGARPGLPAARSHQEPGPRARPAHACRSSLTRDLPSPLALSGLVC